MVINDFGLESPETYGCPRYDKCITGKARTREACSKYRCNTFYQIDTIQLFLDSKWGPKAVAAGEPSDDGNVRKSLDVRVIREMLAREAIGNCNGKNGNGHSSGNGYHAGKVKTGAGSCI